MSRPGVKVFYSWQTDLPRPHNYTLIRKALERAVENIQKDESFPVFPILDRDTLDRSGSVAIADTILEKIEDASVFVGDVSIINKRSRKRKTSNPNVLLETGFAVHRLGWARVVLVNNDHYGKVESLPFDIRHRRLLRYKNEKGYVPPNGRGWVDHIRRKGNEATHEIQMMSKQDGEELISFTEMLLKFIFEFPARVPNRSAKDPPN